MFETLTERLSDVFRQMSGRGRITEDNVRDSLREIRRALLEADVNLDVARQFCDRCMEKAIGQEVIKSLHPGQLMVKVCHDELIELMGPVDTRIYFVSPGPTVILMAGLQGSGKTTTCAKLAKYLLGQGKKPALAACDLQRPAAVEQLSVLGKRLSVPVYSEPGSTDPIRVSRASVNFARKQGCDVVIIDTAGRLHVDQEMMQQVSDINRAVQAHQIYLVCDAMTGQDAATSAKAFNDLLELDGVILTKFDSDARGGAALSVKAVTGKPIKFIGVGEKLHNLEEFHPERMAGRILGMGDMVSLVEKAQEEFDVQQMAKMQQRMAKGIFTLDDFLIQLKGMKRMGSMKDMIKLIPGLGSELKHLDMDDRELVRMEAVILSMTPKERRKPEMVDASRRRRIAKGSGTEGQDVSGLVKSFVQMRGMMKQMAGLGTMDRMRMGKQFAQMSVMGGGKMPKMKISRGAAGKSRQISKRKKRRRR